MIREFFIGFANLYLGFLLKHKIIGDYIIINPDHATSKWKFYNSTSHLIIKPKHL